MSSPGPYDAPKNTGVEVRRIRPFVVLLATGTLLLAQGVVFVTRRILAGLETPAAALDLATLAGIVGASALASAGLRRRVETTRPEATIGLASFAVGQVIATIVVVRDWVVSGQMNVIQVAVAMVAFTLFAAMGAGIGRRMARPG